MDPTELLKNLTSLGILNAGNGGDANPSTPPTANTATTTTTITGAGGGSSSAPQYDLASFRLESKDLQIERPGAVELLYSELPLQCKQCGFRYPATPEGQDRMDAHLDSHFRQNRRTKERVKRGLSRSWFVTEEEWISGSGGETTSHQAPAFLNEQAPADVSTENPDEYMVVKPNEDSQKACSICGERFIEIWNDDEEEWMYKNAVLVNETIYHASCHADAIKSGTFNDVPMSEVDSPAAQKRKAEEQDEGTDAKMARIA